MLPSKIWIYFISCVFVFLSFLFFFNHEEIYNGINWFNSKPIMQHFSKVQHLLALVLTVGSFSNLILYIIASTLILVFSVITWQSSRDVNGSYMFNLIHSLIIAVGIRLPVCKWPYYSMHLSFIIYVFCNFMFFIITYVFK